MQINLLLVFLANSQFDPIKLNQTIISERQKLYLKKYADCPQSNCKADEKYARK